MGLLGGDSSSTGGSSGYNFSGAQVNAVPDYLYGDPDEEERRRLLTQQQADALRQSGKDSKNSVGQAMAQARQLMGNINSNMAAYAGPDYSQ